MESIFDSGFRGLSDTKFSGVKGSVHRSVGIDHRSDPGLLKVHQKLAKDSSTTIDELCKASVNVSDGSKLWFSSESGKVWRESGGTYTLVHTVDSMADFTEVDSKMTTTLDVADTKSVTFGVLMNPSGSEVPELVALAKDAGTSASSTISVNIDVPNESNMSVLVLAGNNDPTDQPYSDSVTFDGNAMSEATGSITLSGTPDFKTNHVVAYGVTPTSGTNKTCTVTFNDGGGGTFTDRFIFVMVFKNVDQTTPLADTDPGGFYSPSEYEGEHTSPAFVDLPGTADNQLKVACVASEDTTGDTSIGHTPASGQTLISEEHNSSDYEYSVSTKPFRVGASKTLDATEFFSVTDISLDDDVVVNEQQKYIYYATEHVLWRIAVENIGSWSGNIETVGTFTNGNDTYHPMVVQNLTLFIGDSYMLSTVSSSGTFTKQSNLNLPEDEEIQALSQFDIDVLIGTKARNHGRTLRWDGFSESWSAEDEVFEKGGVTAFIRDDNYVYVVAGKKGGIYFYNGEQNELVTRIPGVGTGEVKVNHNAVGFLNYVPVFGLSNVSGDTVLQGVYGFGKYSRDYPTALTLDFPVPSDEFTGVEIGSILVDGEDLYIAWKDGTDVGVGKINHSAKYANAYIDTMALMDSSTRHQVKTLSDVFVPYHSKPASTDVTIGVNKDYGSFSDMTTIGDSKRKFVKLKNPSVPDTINPQLKIGFTVNGNDAPEIEDVLWNIAPIGRK